MPLLVSTFRAILGAVAAVAAPGPPSGGGYVIEQGSLDFYLMEDGSTYLLDGL